MGMRLRARLRLWAIYNELGYNPWHKKRSAEKKDGGVYMGARETIPFMNEDGKRTLSHLLLRPGYMMRDYILRGRHEHYLAPITALLVFYSVFTLLVAVVQPVASKDKISQDILDALREVSVQADSLDVSLQLQADSLKVKGRTKSFFQSLVKTAQEVITLTRLDLYPEAVDTPWKESLAAVEGDIRSKGIPLFLGSFLLIWLSMSILLRKYQISVSGAAAASAYILCQFCIFMFLALVFSFGNRTDLGVLLMGALLFIDYRQMLGIGSRPALKLTIKTGLYYALFALLFYVLLGVSLVLFAFFRT